MAAVDGRAFRVERCAEGDGGRWVEALAQLDRYQVRILKEDADTTVFAATVGGRAVVLKRWRLGLGARLKALVKMSRGWRHWRGAERLEKAGVRTAKCYALVIQGGAGGPWQWLVMEHLPGKTLLQHLYDRDLSVRQEHAAAREVGRLLYLLERGWISNRDGKPSNLIALPGDSGACEIAVIDCVAIRHGADGPMMRRMMANLMIETLGCACPPRRTLVMRAVRNWYDERSVDPATRREPPTGNPVYPRAEHDEFVDTWWEYAGHVQQELSRVRNPTPRVDPLNRGKPPHPA